jgi:hypothetical protein
LGIDFVGCVFLLLFSPDAASLCSAPAPELVVEKPVEKELAPPKKEEPKKEELKVEEPKGEMEVQIFYM